MSLPTISKVDMSRMGRYAKTSAIGVIIAGLFFMLARCSAPPIDNPDRALESLVSGFVQHDTSVRNCVLSVLKGDNSFSWSGAAGMASQKSRTPMARDTPLYIASVTKLYTATAVMRLYEEGRLSLDDPISHHLSEALIHRIHVYKGKDYSHEITIAQLLSHSSGIADYYDERPKGGKSLFELFLQNPTRPWTVEETIERARNDLQPNFAPGESTSYSDTNFQLLGKVVEAVSGKPLHVVFGEFFFRPLGLKHTWMAGRSRPLNPSAAPADVFYKDRDITGTRANGAYWADGGIVSTAEEMIAFLKALNEGRIIRPETLELMHHWRSWRFPLQYGFGTMRFRMPPLASKALAIPPLWGHSGSTGSFLYYCEDRDLYMAGTIDQIEAKTAPFRLMRKAMGIVQEGM